ncbi:MAG: hypothetical protein ACO3GL_03160 [Bacteroidia bacterium]
MRHPHSPSFKTLPSLGSWVGLGLGALFLALALSPPVQAQSWAKRQYQNITAHFNGLYYARLRYDEAMQEIHRNHKDDYAQWLPVFVESLDASVSSGASAFEESIKKCSNLIQRKEHSRWVDESFLLIGQCYYLRRDYFDAIETFQYLINRYKGQPNADLAAGWLVRAYTASGQYGPAQGVLERALENLKASKQSRAMLYLAAAENQLAQKRVVKAAEYLEDALHFPMPAAQRRRTHFLLGQIYLQIESRKAPLHFKKALSGRPDPELRFQCKIQSVTAYTDARNGSRNARRILLNLTKSKKYFSYRDVLYFELGLLDSKEKKTQEAEKNFRLSLAHSQEINAQRKKTWITLGDICFEEKRYEEARFFFDSLNNNLEKEHPRFKEIRNKQAYLGEMVRHLKTITVQDSLLELGALPENKLTARLTKILDEERKQAALAKAKAEDSAKNARLANSNNNWVDPLMLQRNMGAASMASSGGEWHFYNTQLIGSDYNQFLQIWGKRENTDHWRRSAGGKGGPEEGTTNATSSTESESDPLLDSLNKLPRTVENLMLRIPRDEASRNKSLSMVRNAHLSLTKLYKDRLGDYRSALPFAEAHLTRFPQTSTEPEILYHAFRCYEALSDTQRRLQCARVLDSLYPESPFTGMINGKSTGVSDSMRMAAESHYRYCYRLYTSGRYDSVVLACKWAKSRFASDTLMPYFGFLESISAARKDSSLLQRSLETYASATSPVALASAAQGMLDILFPEQARNRATSGTETETGRVKDRYEFKGDSIQPHYLVLRMNASVYQKNIEIGVKVSRFAEKNFRRLGVKISYPVYREVEQLVLIKEAPDRSTALQFWKQAQADPELFRDLALGSYDWFFVARDDFNKLYKNLSLNDYLILFQREHQP